MSHRRKLNERSTASRILTRTARRISPSAPTSTFAFAGGGQFTIAGVPIARDAAVVEAGFDLKMAANATLGLSYSGQFGGGSADNGAKVNLNVKF